MPKMWQCILKRNGEPMERSFKFAPDRASNGDISGWILTMDERIQLGDTIEVIEVED